VRRSSRGAEQRQTRRHWRILKRLRAHPLHIINAVHLYCPNVEPVIDLGFLRLALRRVWNRSKHSCEDAGVGGRLSQLRSEGEIIVPAGSKAVGHIQQADRSGYMTIQSIRYDARCSSHSIEGVATNF